MVGTITFPKAFSHLIFYCEQFRYSKFNFYNLKLTNQLKIHLDSLLTLLSLFLSSGNEFYGTSPSPRSDWPLVISVHKEYGFRIQIVTSYFMHLLFIVYFIFLLIFLLHFFSKNSAYCRTMYKMLGIYFYQCE